MGVLIDNIVSVISVRGNLPVPEIIKANGKGSIHGITYGHCKENQKGIVQKYLYYWLKGFIIYKYSR